LGDETAPDQARLVDIDQNVERGTGAAAERTGTCPRCAERGDGVASSCSERTCARPGARSGPSGTRRFCEKVLTRRACRAFARGRWSIHAVQVQDGHERDEGRRPLRRERGARTRAGRSVGPITCLRMMWPISCAIPRRGSRSSAAADRDRRAELDVPLARPGVISERVTRGMISSFRLTSPANERDSAAEVVLPDLEGAAGRTRTPVAGRKGRVPGLR
jgi:hypothetical protein